MTDKPVWMRNRYKPLTQDEIVDLQRQRTAHVCSLKAVDEAVGAMFTALGTRANNTVVIYMSDNGFSFGEHRYVAKNCAYEECIRVPLVIRAPMVSRTKRTVTGMAQNIDVPVTIALLTGARIPAGANGKSLLPILAGERDSVRDTLLIEYYNGVNDAYDAAVRTDRFKYVRLGQTREEEFYNLVEDPYELTNQIAAPKYAEEIRRLKDELAALRNVR
jgi:arylsulfatase A-like enzyme